MEAQSEYAHIACTFFARSVPILYAQSVISNKISASELSQKFIKGALLVGSVCQPTHHPSTYFPVSSTGWHFSFFSLSLFLAVLPTGIIPRQKSGIFVFAIIFFCSRGRKTVAGLFCGKVWHLLLEAHGWQHCFLLPKVSSAVIVVFTTWSVFSSASSLLPIILCRLSPMKQGCHHLCRAILLELVLCLKKWFFSSLFTRCFFTFNLLLT